MKYQHKNLALGRWNTLTLSEQMANIGSEVIRALKWLKKGDREYSQLASDRALELFDLTLSDGKNRKRLKEIARMREIVVEFFYGKNQYDYTAESLENYFFAFNYYIAVNR